MEPWSRLLAWPTGNGAPFPSEMRTRVDSSGPARTLPSPWRRSMSEPLERSVLERKERDELATIAEAMGVKPTSRASKSTLIESILREAGIETAAPPEEK